MGGQLSVRFCLLNASSTCPHSIPVPGQALIVLQIITACSFTGLTAPDLAHFNSIGSQVTLLKQKPDPVPLPIKAFQWLINAFRIPLELPSVAPESCDVWSPFFSYHELWRMCWFTPHPTSPPGSTPPPCHLLHLLSCPSSLKMQLWCGPGIITFEKSSPNAF